MGGPLSTIVFILCLASKGLAQQSANSSSDNFLITPSFSLDNQVNGFNSTNLTSGIVVLVDKRTLFIADIYYKNVESNNLEFWAGTGISPNNDTSKRLVDTKAKLPVSSNIYITLPTDLTLDVINYLEVSVNNQSVTYVNLSGINRTAIPGYDQQNQDDTIYRLPKCCPSDQQIDFEIGCVKAMQNVPLRITVFESNATGLDPNVTINSSEYQVAPYYQMPKCGRLGQFYSLIASTELQGFIYNSSLIIEHKGILSHQNFCIDVAYDEEELRDLIFHCRYVVIPKPDPDFYLPVLCLSIVGFALSAIAYGIVLKVRDLHTISLVLFSSTMGVAFICLVIMQVQSNNVACSIFGFIFLLSLMIAFLWLLILCLELLYLVKYPIEEDRHESRWKLYTGLSLGIPFFLFIISVSSGTLGVPDIPRNLIKFYGEDPDACTFDTSTSRSFILFTLVIVSIAGSFASLVVLQIFFNKNEKDMEIKNHVDWMSHFNSYKFLSRTYFMITFVAAFWLMDLIDPTHIGKTHLAIDVIKASLGVVTFLACVGNKYTRRELQQKLWKKKQKNHVTETDLGLDGMRTPNTPVEVDPLISQLSNGNNGRAVQNSTNQ